MAITNHERVGKAMDLLEQGLAPYTLCERKKRAPEALRYNALVQSWPEITRLATHAGTTAAQQEIF